MEYGCDKRAPRKLVKRAAEAREALTAGEWVEKKLGLRLDAQQTRVVESVAKRGILNCCRQWGKSTTSAAKAVHQAVMQEESLTIVISPTARQSAEFVRKASELVQKLGMAAKGDGDNEISLAFPNGSRIVGLPGNEATVRGFSSVGLIVVDEASRVSDELYLAIRPMLAVSEGALWLMSTPYGKRGFFYEAWANGGPGWERVQVRATECPRIGANFLKEERREFGERWFRQEYLCEFVDSVSGIFDRELLESAVTYDVEPLKLR